jgi:hypothetical protein
MDPQHWEDVRNSSDEEIAWEICGGWGGGGVSCCFHCLGLILPLRFVKFVYKNLGHYKIRKLQINKI